MVVGSGPAVGAIRGALHLLSDLNCSAKMCWVGTFGVAEVSAPRPLPFRVAIALPRAALVRVAAIRKHTFSLGAFAFIWVAAT